MQRPEQYGDAGVNSIMAAQRTQYNSGRKQFSGRADEEHQYMSSNAEGQWQWDLGNQKGSNIMSVHMYKEDQGSDASRSSHNNLRSDSKMSSEKQMGRDSRAQLHPNQKDMEYGYDDNNAPQKFETLEQKFLQDIMKLTKEHQEAEDKENARHRERLNEIDSKYLENLMTTRARQATHRDDFLHKESLARHQQYQQAFMSSYQNNVAPSDAYGGGYVAAALAAPHQAYEGGNFESYRGRGRGLQSRGQHRGGRAYNSGGRYY